MFYCEIYTIWFVCAFWTAPCFFNDCRKKQKKTPCRLWMFLKCVQCLTYKFRLKPLQCQNIWSNLDERQLQRPKMCWGNLMYALEWGKRACCKRKTTSQNRIHRLVDIYVNGSIWDWMLDGEYWMPCSQHQNHYCFVRF